MLDLLPKRVSITPLLPAGAVPPLLEHSAAAIRQQLAAHAGERERKKEGKKERSIYARVLYRVLHFLSYRGARGRACIRRVTSSRTAAPTRP